MLNCRQNGRRRLGKSMKGLLYEAIKVRLVMDDNNDDEYQNCNTEDTKNYGKELGVKSEGNCTTKF